MKLKILPLLVLTSCCMPPAHEPLAAAPDAGVDLATCAAACARRRELGCASAQPSPGGASCEVVCENAVRYRILRREDLACRAAAFSCAVMDDCP